MNAQAAQILLGALAQVPGAARDLDGWDHDGTRRLESGATEWAFEHECGQAIDVLIGPGSEVEWEWYPAAGRQPDGSFLLYNPAPAGAEQHVQLEASRAAGPFAF